MYRFTLFTVLATVSLTFALPPTFKDCGIPSKRTFHVERLQLPNPVHIGRPNKMSVKINIKQDLSPNDMVRMDIYREQSLVFKTIWVHIPCVPVVNLGSCENSVQTWFQKSSSMMCSILKQFDLKCEAGVPAGLYEKPDVELKVDRSIIPPGIGGVVSGRYKVSIKLKDAKTRVEKGCFDIELNLN